MMCIDFLREEPLSRHTSFRVGGPAEIFVKPQTTDELIEIWNSTGWNLLPVEIIGDGTNVLVSDAGLRGIVICTNKMNGIDLLEGGRIRARAGARLSKVAEVACRAGLAGFEFASGIPGTVGGAVYMNAGAYDHDIGEFCESVTMLDVGTACGRPGLAQCYPAGGQRPPLQNPHAGIIVKPGTEMEFGYRKSCVQQGNMIVLEAIFQLQPGSPAEIRAKMNELNSRRRASQPLDMPSAGSTFKRPPGHFAGKLIEDSGLKGFTIGGAQVSRKHAGFIVNTGSATAQDIYDLIQAVREKVHENFNIWLEPEIKLLGFS